MNIRYILYLVSLSPKRRNAFFFIITDQKNNMKLILKKYQTEKGIQNNICFFTVEIPPFLQ
jgi:hypothetical protein